VVKTVTYIPDRPHTRVVDHNLLFKDNLTKHTVLVRHSLRRRLYLELSFPL
jgi:hypothetical protein